MCIHYVGKLLTLVYTFYHRPVKPVKDVHELPESHWGQWSVIDEN
jgi:hypothetical protein